jgi:1-acyl-sn-glycerol-3-phosphate acyltransferase
MINQENVVEQNKTIRSSALKQSTTASSLYSRCPNLWNIQIQSIIGRILLLPFCGLLVGVLRFSGRYRIDNLKDLRQTYQQIVQSDTPLIICANHLTFIDSALMIWAMGSNFWYLFNYKKFSWNLPAGDFFKKKLWYQIVAYLTKCIFIHRDGTKQHQNAVLGICRDLLNRGEVITIFPEGKRSRTGKFEPDKITYGVGKIISQLEDCRVLCVYIRGEHQDLYSNYPKKGSRFHVEFKLIVPTTEATGRDAYYDLTMQIATTIKGMEDRYFEMTSPEKVGLPC